MRLRAPLAFRGAATTLLIALLAQLPGTTAWADAPAAKPAATPAAPPDLRAVAQVTIEQQGRMVAVGVVLGGDGRILSSLRLLDAGGRKVPGVLSSPDVSVHYADGFKVRARVMHTDAEAGLALVVPLEGRRTQGVKPSTEAPVGAGAGARVLRAGKETSLSLVAGAVPFLKAEPAAEDLKAGTPVFDGSGAVLAITVRQCPPDEAAPAAVCPSAFVPVSYIRGFLKKTPPGATIPSAWLGIGGEALDTGAVRGVRVIAVAPNSPASAAGLSAAAEADKTDVILSVDGEAVATPEALGAKIGAHGVGDKAKLLVFRGNRLRDVVVVLKSAP